MIQLDLTVYQIILYQKKKNEKRNINLIHYISYALISAVLKKDNKVKLILTYCGKILKVKVLRSIQSKEIEIVNDIPLIVL